MWTGSLVTGWYPVPVTEVAAIVQDPGVLPRWHSLVSAITADVAGETAGKASIRLAGHDIPARWRVDRRTGQRLEVNLTDHDGGDLELMVTWSPWHGGTMVELAATGTRFAGRRLRSRSLERELQTSLANLADGLHRPVERAPLPASIRRVVVLEPGRSVA